MESPILLFSSILASLFNTPYNAISFAYSILLPFTSPSKENPVPEILYSSLFGNNIFLAVCSFTVRVPVLSLAITVHLALFQRKS